MNPLVSIVIPVFNGSNYLRSAIDSALAQTYENCEVIVVNDGSTDGGKTGAIATSYKNRLRYFEKSNGGVSSALNLGIAQMKGDYFSWLSHDDMYSPNKVEEQIKFLQGNAGVGIVGSGLEEIDNDGRRVSSYSTGSIAVVRNGRDVMGYWVYGCSLMINRAIFDKTGVFNERCRTVQDIELWLKMVYAGHSMHLLPGLLCQWRHHSDMGSYQLRPDYIREIEALFRDLLEIYPLEFFSDRERGSLTRRDKALVYDWLGEQARHRGASRMAKRFFAAAAMSYPNPFDAISRATIRKVLSGVKQAILH